MVVNWRGGSESSESDQLVRGSIAILAGTPSRGGTGLRIRQTGVLAILAARCVWLGRVSERRSEDGLRQTDGAARSRTHGRQEPGGWFCREGMSFARRLKR